ncbi:uncharacterized protein LOC143175495 [Nomia melanderi]|uniref:uncharacterized protein LOC143175494 n=1 Tax=Nomia melanderi TaxID=2448451 RepID=UPI003FCE77B4
MLRTSQKERNEEWDEILNFCCLAYSTIIYEATGFTPFELTFSQKANLASSVTANSQRTYTKYKLEKENGILNCNMLGKHYRKANKGQPAFSPSPGTSRMD